MTPSIEDTLKTLPLRPGVYRMIGAGDVVLYVGKAKSLKSRVSSYFVKSGHSARISMMIAQIVRIETTVTRSEAEALILENNLIKSLEPRYNILFRDDKSYPYLCISGDPFPQIRMFRGKPDRKHQYFGPFPNGWAVREGVNTLQKVFQLRTCDNTVFAHRSRPCMLAQIGRCTAPCVEHISKEDYAADVQRAVLFMHGKQDEVVGELQTQMEQASSELAFEKAAALRDKIVRLKSLASRQFVSSNTDRDVDVLAVVQQNGMIVVNIVMIRGGQHLGDRSFFPQRAASTEAMVESDLADTLESFIAQHYLERDVPRELVVNLAFDAGTIETALSEQAKRKIVINGNPNGEKRVWLRMAEQNAELAITVRQQQSDTGEYRLHALINALDLPEGTKRLECFDISHTMGEATVASCVVFDGTGMQTNQYRRYNIETTDTGDDYTAMREVLSRRAARIAKDELPRPDVWVIDGGKGQVGVAAEVLQEAGLGDIVLFGSAKGVERKKGMEQLIFPDRELAVRLPADHPGLHLIQQMQDEAHRFAIQGHRARRAKAREGSALDDIEGIGPKKRGQLLREFGSVRGLAAASVEDIARVPGISPDLAERIYQALH